MQDGVGCLHVNVQNVGYWFSKVKDALAAARPATQLWSDLETFTDIGVENFVPAPQATIEAQIAAEKAYVVKFTSFSLNHYQSPNNGCTTEYNAYKTYALSQP